MSTPLDGPFKHIALLILSTAVVSLSPDTLVSGNEDMVLILIPGPATFHTFNVRQWNIWRQTDNRGGGGGGRDIEGQRKEENGAHF
jgi:hypothetical protein